MSLHDWFGLHVADTSISRWDRGRFVTGCAKCGRAMIKLPGLAWQIEPARG